MSGEGEKLQLRGLVERCLEREKPLRLQQTRGSASAFLLARIRATHTGPILVITPTSTKAESFAADMQTFAPDAEMLFFPRHDTPPFDRFSSHPELEARRMSLLYRLLSADDGSNLTVTTPWSALLRRVLPRTELRGRVTHLERGMTVDRDALLDVLVSAGYHRTSIVEERGEVAARGNILDLFPPQLDRAVRLEFDFEDLSSIRYFDTTNQRSDEELRNIVAIPPRSYRLPGDLDDLLRRVRNMGRDKGVPESNIYALNEALARRHFPSGIENVETLFHEGFETLFDYLPESTLIIVDDPEAGLSRAEAYLEEVYQGHGQAKHQDRLVSDPNELYLTDEEIREHVWKRRPLLMDRLGLMESRLDEDQLKINTGDHRDLRREVKEARGSGRALEPLSRRLTEWSDSGQRVRVVCPSLSAAERMNDILGDYGHDVPIVRREAGGDGWVDATDEPLPQIVVASLSEGFVLPMDELVVVTERDVFGARIQRRPPRRTRSGLAIDRLAQIQDSDTLVHAEHGIGQYGGLAKLSVGGVDQEFLLLLYDKGDKLYLPISRLGQVQRYSGADAENAKLDRLGSQTWTRTKQRVKHAVKEMAEELLAVTAARQLLRGHRYPAPDRGYEEFEAAFPYEDTPDQRRAADEVLADLQGERPMDRLVCGDVGFGKTEIACRATYLVTAGGRQVAFLVPTTILCQQHMQTLKDRFANTAVNIVGLSRYTSAKEAREIREGLASGRVDVVVGTHRLLSKDIQFRNLGMVIVDEEHRFGVTHKEKLKQMRKLVDVLTLSATPIPRTLHMSMTGLRDLSVMMTPPPDRTAIRTQVCRLSDDVVREAILRELRRDGQIFAVHNRVETIEEFAEYLSGVVPEAKITIGHGQMSSQKLEDVMLKFVDREYNILVCTAIIESGLDIPNANTILIHRSDLFGLAQLYQLRGRVGRSDRRAYAYLFLPPHGNLSHDAQRRVEAIQDLSELGAGFRLASEDLEIRGAGNVLGGEQSGHIASVGYDLYVEMLDQAIAELQGQNLEDAIEPEIRLPISALLPDNYVADVNQRLVLYKQLSSARSDEELYEIRDDLMDRYGALPEAAKNLLEVIRLKIGCRRLGIESIETANGELVLHVTESTKIRPDILVGLLNKPGTPLRVTPDHRIFLTLRTLEDALPEAHGLLDLLGPEAKSNAGTAIAESA